MAKTAAHANAASSTSLPLIASTRPGGDDLAFLRLLLGGIRNDDATLRLLVGVDAADHDAVVQGAKFHESAKDK